MLAPTDIPGYLLERRLLSPRAVVDGGFRVDDRSRRNAVFVVSAEGEPRYVLKIGADDGALAREAGVLAALGAAHARGPLADCLPVVAAHDTAAGVLILESPARARDLAVHHAGGRYSCELASKAGRALGQLHATSVGAMGARIGAAHPAWRAPLHQLDRIDLYTSSPAALELTRIVQDDDELCAELDALLADDPSRAVIHGDVRWQNCLAVCDDRSGRWTRLLLIDWELSCAGDPAHDLGGFLGEYLGAWRRSIAISNPVEGGDAERPLPRMRPAVRRFWEGYVTQRGLPPAARGVLLRRSVRFAGLRLVTTAFEEAQAMDELRPSTLQLLALGRRVLRGPGRAARLLGLATGPVSA